MAWVSREFADEMTGGHAADGKTGILGLHTAQVILHSDRNIEAAMENILADTGLPVTSRKTMTVQYEAETRASAVMGNTISVIIALVGVLNFINSMVTAIVSRKKEFAMIQSVGMTKRQLRKMLIFEGLDYAVITLIVSYIASALAVGIGVRAMTATFLVPA